jgi:ATP-dependent helicase HrpB
MGIDPARAAQVARVRKQLDRLVDARVVPPPGSPVAWEEAALIAVLSGFPDRVGRLRRPAHATGRSAREVAFAGGGTAALSESSGVADVDLVVAVDVEERTEGPGTRTKTVVRMASAVEADWLLELYTDAIRDTTDAVWNASAERVEVVRRLAYDGLVLEETRGVKSDAGAIARVLADAVRAKGWRAFARGEDLDQWLLRAAFVREHCPDAGLPPLDEASIEAMLAELCEGSQSFADLREHDLAAKLRERLDRAQARALAELAPETIALPGGRRLRVAYAQGAAPSAESRLQDFFGMREGPRIAGGRVPVVLHLLAPNHRAVQVTTDLAGFWSKHYPAIAKELRRRYPRHAWPDDPLTAQPPTPRR